MLVRLQRELFPLHASHRQRKHHLPVVLFPLSLFFTALIASLGL